MTWVKLLPSLERRAPARALSVGRQAHDRLAASGGVGSVHSWYDGAVNVSVSGGLISLVPQHYGMGPMNITFGTSEFERLADVPAKGAVRITSHGLSLPNSFRFDLGAEIYDPSPLFEREVLSAALISRNSSVAQETTIVMGKLGGVGSLLLDPDEGSEATFGAAFSRLARPAAEELIGSLRRRDAHSATAAARRLVGLGVGLTPSGDDLLSGLMLASVLGSKNGVVPAEIPSMLSGIPTMAEGMTSVLSLEFLKQAAEGRANEKLRCLVEEIYTGDERSVEERTREVVRMGETSGTDTVVGLLLGIGMTSGVGP